MKNGNKNSSKKAKIVVSVVVMIIAICFIPIIIIAARYNSTSYINEKPVERPDGYVLPEYPDVILDTEYTDEDIETGFSIVDKSEAGDGLDDLETEVTILDTDVDVTSEDTENVFSVVNDNKNTSGSSIDKTEVKTSKPSNKGSTGVSNSFGTSSNAVSVYSKKYPIYSVEQRDSDILNILVLGTDTRDVTIERGRSDTMIVVSYNKKTAEVKLVSFLRDSLVPIADHDWNRLNTAYAFGGAGLAVNTINELFGLDIQYFVAVDFTGAKSFIDKVGGVDVTLTQKEAEYLSKAAHTEIKSGVVHMNSRIAMLHMRNRFTDNDFGRTRRQRDIIVAVMKKLISEKSISEITELIDYAMTIVKTNIPVTMLASLATSVVSNISNLTFESQQVPYTDSFKFAWYNRMAIISFDIEEAAERVSKFIWND